MGSSFGVAFSAFTGDLYVGDLEHQDVHVFAEAEATGKARPLVRECAGEALTPVSARVGCVVHPNEAAGVYVEYGEVGSATLLKSAEQQVTSNGRVEVEVSGLRPQAKYRFVMVASNAEGVGRGREAGFATPVAVRGVTGCDVSGVENESATLHGSLEPTGSATSWYFEYGPTTAYGSRTPEESSSSTTPVAAAAAVRGLSPFTGYHCRLVARDGYGTTLGADGEFTTTRPPLVDGESFSEVGDLHVVLGAVLEDEGAVGSYRFEYGTSTAYGSSTPEVALGAQAGEQGVRGQLSGLEPGTVYHFRVVVSDAHGTTAGVDRVFRTFPSSAAALPDGRVYEMVSPVTDDVYVPEAGNGPFPVATMLPFQALGDGNAVAYAGAPAQGGNGDAGAGGGNEFFARFTPEGWVAQDVMPPGGGGSPVFLAFSSDLSTGVLESREALAPSAPGGGYDDLYSTSTTGTGAYHPLFAGAPPDRSAEEFASAGTLGPKGAGLAYAGASADFSHLFFEANDALEGKTTGAEDPGVTGNDLYESTGGQLSVVNRLPGGQLAADATFGAANESGEPADPPDFNHAVSADGSRVFWTDLSTGDLYVRENGTATVQVDAAHGGSGPGGGGRFWTASSDGSRVFFTDAATAGLTSSTQAGSGINLYEYDVPDGELVDLSAATHAGVLGVIGANEEGGEGSYVYFVAEGVLADRNVEGGEPVAGQPNLYLSHGGQTDFIATLAPEGPNGDEGNALYAQGAGSFGDWEPGVGHRTAQVTPGGRGVVFQSVRPLTGYDSEGLGEVFVYDAVMGRLACASCDPSGEAPPVRGFKAAGYLPVSWSRTYQPRLISEDGDRVFFDSFEPLVSQDTNGQQDVYEWERDGTGSCQEAAGCVYLLSLGTSQAGSYLVDASASGNDVFFVSDARLVPQDDNEVDHLYDDRVEGVQPSALAGCAGVSCEQVPIAPPIFAAPPSATFAGVGNFPPPTPVSTTRVKKHANKKAKKKAKVKKHRLRGAKHGKPVGVKRRGRS